MLYLIGGASRVGKSTLANRILEKEKIAYLDMDWIVHMLMFSAPQLGISYASAFTLDAFIDKAEKFYPYLYQFVKYNQPVVDRYVVEGDSILPNHVSQLQKEFDVRACFLGASHISPEIFVKYKSKNNWITNLNNSQLHELCSWIMDISTYLESECARLHIRYFDVSKNYTDKVEQAYRHLLTS